ncbi:unnamed protein product [Euphydryas editha]|uniref:Uncharacterized protein n=1 Tax=Euphydryas editha TaxID=104508 RepID=A0AAU9TF08_EUPED|nr:unnamed protein product [Euphydryas editha]
MKFSIALCVYAVILNNVRSMPLLPNNNSISPLVTNQPGIASVPTINTYSNVPGTFGNMNNFVSSTLSNGGFIGKETTFNMNYVPNNIASGNAILANEALSKNMLANANAPLANELFGNAVITNANFVPISNMPSGFPVTPMISEIIPSLQFGDITMSGDLPVGGTIKVCGCFPVYGMVSVDGSVPSAGTAVVADAFGNPVVDLQSKCENHIV